MSIAVLETERDRLATPVELVTVPPPSFVAPEFEQLEIRTDDGTPSFVIRARAFAEEQPDSPAALVQLAQAEQSIGEAEAAVDAARRALAALDRSGDDPLAFAAVQLLLGCGRADLANQALEQIKNDEARNLLRARLAIEEGNLGKATELLSTLDSPDAVGTKGWIALELHHFAEAVRLFRSVLRADGPSVPLLINLGYAYAALGARDKAIRVTRQAQVLSPADELIGFNLVSFYVANGELENAREEVVRLREWHPTRMRFDLAEADLFLRARDATHAYTVLRRARYSRLWAYAESEELAELEANLAFVEWRLGKKSRPEAANEVIKQLERTHFNNLGIAGFIPTLLPRRRNAARLEEVYESLKRVHPDESLLFFRTHLALTRSEFEEAADLAATWADDQMFNGDAAGLAVYLLVEVAQDTERAISLGRRALRTAGVSDGLVNNVAYAYALAGNLAEARALLRERRDDSIFLTATRGLVEIFAGNVELGSSYYQRAYELAEKKRDEDPDLPAKVRLNQALALHRAGQTSSPTQLPADWQESPYLALFAKVAKRTGLPLA